MEKSLIVFLNFFGNPVIGRIRVNLFSFQSTRYAASSSILEDVI